MDKRIEQNPENLESSNKYIDGSLHVLDETLEIQSDKVSEVVGDSTNETSVPQTQKKDDSKVVHGFGNFSSKISKLLFRGEKSSEIPKTRKEQEKRIESELKKEQQRLMKQAQKMSNGKYFSASKFEKTIRQVRELQRIIGSLVDIALDQLRDLYNKYVLKS